MTARYPYAVKPNTALRISNTFALPVGTPVVKDDDWFVAPVAMKVGAYTLAHSASPDALARNVIVTVTGSGADSGDTMGTITVRGVDAAGAAISEVIIPAVGLAVAGEAAFAGITSITGAGWVTKGAADTVKVGFGDLVGMPIDFFYGRPNAPSFVVMTLLDGLPKAFVEGTDAYADVISLCTVDAHADYDGAAYMTLVLARKP